MLFYGIAALVIIADQVSKFLIRIHLKIGEIISLWGVHITHYENSGMARSMFPGHGRYFAGAAVLFVAIIFYYRKKGVLQGLIMDIGTGFLVGGAVGNAIDRILFGQVTDFIMIRSGSGILNLADYAINIGMLIFLAGIAAAYLRKFLPVILKHCNRQ